MGYYTSYSLEIEPYNEDIHKHLLEFVNEGDNPFDDRCKWYDCNEEMKKFSSLYPKYLFHINGQGDENEDIWIATFKNGKVHERRAEIIIPPYDETKLE